MPFTPRALDVIERLIQALEVVEAGADSADFTLITEEDGRSYKVTVEPGNR
jgi:hypothetical protein